MNNDFYPYFTNDGSVGLFSPQDDDIYHSTFGALTEAYEKFILPTNLEEYFKSNNEIKVLDICYGIGYNSKSFLNFYFEKIYKNKNKKFSEKFLDVLWYIVPIHTDNILKELRQFFNPKYRLYSGAIHTDKNSDIKLTQNANKTKIFINAIDIDESLVYLSPLFKISNKTGQMDFDNKKIKDLLSKKINRKFSLKNFINIILFEKLIENAPLFFENKRVNKILAERKNRPFFDPFMRRFYAHFQKFRYSKRYKRSSRAFLHNIYYRYISIRYKMAARAFKNVDLDIQFNFNDARQVLLNDKNTYNLIFLDAFTPTKCPALWTFEFAKLLYEHLDDDGIILTYSSAANIRHAFLSAGFYVGKNISQENGKCIGTIFAKNKTRIKNELSEYDLGLLKTRAGIFYRDKNLNGLNEAIIEAHKKEVENSDLVSSSKYIKEYKGY